VLLTATEQLNPLIIDLIIRYCNELIHEYKNLDVLIAITPQTYFNYIITKEILQGMCSESININIQGYIIPTTEGLVSKIIALGIVGNINRKSLAIALIQGNMIAALPIYIELRKILGSDISKKVMFI